MSTTSTTCPPYGAGNCGSTPTAPTPTSTSIGTPIHRSPNDLPFTGGDVIGLAIGGGIIVLAGVAALIATKRADRWERKANVHSGDNAHVSELGE